MDIGTDRLPPMLRLMQLVSPTLPIGAFTYSQGIEYAVEAGWIADADQLGEWLRGQMSLGLVHVELPLLARLYQAAAAGDVAALGKWNALLLAARETRELRDEEIQRGRALITLLGRLDVPMAHRESLPVNPGQTLGFALAASHWRIPLDAAAAGFAWSWLDNLVTAGVKLIPLGQTRGQQLLLELSELLPEFIARGLAVDDADIGASAPALAIASTLHERQYTRLFRS